MLDTAPTVTDHTHTKSPPRWTRYAISLAGAWSLLYGALSAFWALGGEGVPFGRAGDPDAEVSIVGHLDGVSVARGMAVFALAGVVVAVAMHRSRGTWHIARGTSRAPRVAVLGFAWAAALGLTVVLPDYRLLLTVAYTPILLVGGLFGWPEGYGLLDLYKWPVVHQFILAAGGLAWAAAAVTYLRRISDACARCGRTAVPSRWTTPDAAARWGRWAVAVAVVIPVLYAVTRWAWALGVPLGISEAFLREGQRTGLWIAGATLASMGIGGAILTLGLTQRWGEIFPRWIPGLAGRRVPPRLATIPAALVSVLVTTAGFMYVRMTVAGYYGRFLAQNWAAVAPELLWPAWGAALGAATLAYHYRRRGRCPACDRT